MKKISKILISLIMILILTPIVCFTTANASENNFNDKKASVHSAKEASTLKMLPTRIWVTRQGISSQHYIFYKEQTNNYRGYLQRVKGSWTSGSLANFEGYIYRPDLSYPIPAAVPEHPTK